MLATALRIFLQAILIFVMLFCTFGFAASFEYPSINKYQIAYTALLVFFSFLFFKLAGNNKAHKQVSSYMISFVVIIWLAAIIHALFNSTIF